MRKMKLFKYLHSSRVLLSLALCSVALVGFSTVVYAAAATGALTGDPSASPESFFLGGPAEPESDPLAEPIADPETPLTSGPLLTLMSPVLQEVAAAPKVDTSSSAETPKASEAVNQVEVVDSSSDDPYRQSAFSAEAEQAFHDHIAKYYAELPTYYNQLCAGLNTAYSIVNSPEGGKVSVAPLNGESYIQFLDAKRIEAENCWHGGAHINEHSKWYAEYAKVCALYNNLENVSSVVREISRLESDDARESLAHYSNSSGKISELAVFEQNYPKVQL